MTEPPAVADGVVFIGSEDEQLYALDLATGATKWVYKCGPVKASPAYHDGAVYVGDSNGLFHCVDAKTGTKRLDLSDRRRDHVGRQLRRR